MVDNNPEQENIKFLDFCIIFRTNQYSHHLKTGQSGIQIVIFWTQFVSGFQMVKSAILFSTIQTGSVFRPQYMGMAYRPFEYLTI
jgi:hypothetical protein